MIAVLVGRNLRRRVNVHHP